MPARSIPEILSHLNELRALNGKTALKDGKAGKAKLLLQIDQETVAARKAGLLSEETPIPTLPVEEKADEAQSDPMAHVDAGRCPWGHDESSQTAGGNEGTFLGDSCRFCHECGKTYNVYSAEEVFVAAPGKTKKRRVLNPQGKIDAKVAALTDVGIEAAYVRPSRLWKFSIGKTILTTMTSKDFAAYTPAELTRYVQTHIKQSA